MPRVTKYEDAIYEKAEYSGKIFMYTSNSWNILFPVVDIIRSLRKNTIISFKYGRGQQYIKTYGAQYNHIIMGYDLKTKKDYLQNLKAVKNIFIFSDESDIIADNLMKVSKKNNINIICYSNIDSIYHFYKGTEKFSLKTPNEVLEKMYYYMELESAKKFADLFDDFEIIELPNESKIGNLEECVEKLKLNDIKEKKEKDKNSCKVLFDPHLNKLKQIEHERSQRNMIFPDSVDVINQKEQTKQKTILKRLFSKQSKVAV